MGFSALRQMSLRGTTYMLLYSCYTYIPPPVSTKGATSPPEVSIRPSATPMPEKPSYTCPTICHSYRRNLLSRPCQPMPGDAVFPFRGRFLNWVSHHHGFPGVCWPPSNDPFEAFPGEAASIVVYENHVIHNIGHNPYIAGVNAEAVEA